MPYCCPKHGKPYMVVQELEAGAPYHSEVWCNFRAGDEMCSYRRELDERQVTYAVRKYPNCEMHDYGYLKTLKQFAGKNWKKFYGTDIFD